MEGRQASICFLLIAGVALTASSAFAGAPTGAASPLIALFDGDVSGADASAWTEIPVPESFVDDLNETRTPRCSGAPVPSGSSNPAFAPADPSFSFFVQPGDAKRLAIIFDGGGACWDAATCIGSVLAGEIVYAPDVDETPEALAALGGIADTDNPDNPLAGFTRVFVPYCTGDLFFGARETTYSLSPEVSWTVHHRGHDNVLAVLHQLAGLYEHLGHDPEEIVLLGGSAGGYGALYSMPAVARTFPLADRLRLLSDSANGVVGDALYDQALLPGGVWGTWLNLAPELEEAFLAGPSDIIADSFRDLGWSYPFARFGQYTRAYDGAQIFFYNVTKHSGNPALWTDPTELFVSLWEWTLQARGAMWRTAWMTWNYRFYLAQGIDHTIFGVDDFYDERSARGIPFSEWLADMLSDERPYRSQWRNASCAPYCLPENFDQLLPTP